ncbi:histone H2A-like [Lucilia cuprina]|uniref:histone H2A-like n=1 Tax=Lucilia cuprina TaxID=7375 RepID=UPI001F06E872|nr:histone H2A-like [Lucilia cuprina]
MARPNKKKTVRKSRSKKANLKFPVARIHRYLRKGRYAERIEQAGYIANERRGRIEPRDIKFAIALDEDLKKFLPNITIPKSQMFLYVEPALLNKK